MIYFRGRIFFFLISLLSVLPLFAEAENPDLIIKRGLENCYMFRWKSAEKDFWSVIKSNPSDPRGYHYLSSIYLWYYLSSNSQSDLDQFLKYSDQSVHYGENILDKNPDDQLTGYIMGNTYSYRTLGYAKSGSYINAIWSSKKSEKYLKRVIENNPSFYDAYLGLGLYNFAAAQIPSAFKWALNLAGISGDEETGIRYIKIAAEKGNLSKVEAQYYLSQLFSGAVPDYGAAKKLLEALMRRYPGNMLFSYALGVVYMKQRNPDGAESLLSNVSRQQYPEFRQVISFSNFVLGDLYFHKNDFQKALESYKKFLSTAANKDYTAIASLRAGISCELLKNRAEAVAFYNRTSGGNSDIEDDEFAKRRGQVLKKHELTAVEITLINFSNQIESGNYKTAYDGLTGFFSSIDNSTKKAEASYYISESAFYMGNAGESLKYALLGADMDTGDEEWIQALCCFNAARAYKSLGNTKMMEEYINRTDDSNDGDYQKMIDNLLKSLKRQ